MQGEIEGHHFDVVHKRCVYCCFGKRPGAPSLSSEIPGDDLQPRRGE
jgi:hypothetical protein